jgi:hypothetical protein
MRALLMATVLAVGTPALADPLPMYVRAVPERLETPAPREQKPGARKPVVLTLAMREPPEEARLLDHARPPQRPSLMQQLRDRIYDELPVVSTAVLAPLPISTADGTLAGVGVLGKF